MTIGVLHTEELDLSLTARLTFCLQLLSKVTFDISTLQSFPLSLSLVTEIALFL